MSNKRLTILGGGPAGMGVAFYAEKKGRRYEVYEASGTVGGNAQTFKHGNFLIDSGAHRFHDKNASITADVLELMGDKIHVIDAPSKIYSDGQLFNFPLTPGDILRKLRFSVLLKASWDLIKARFIKRTEPTFEMYAVKRYGRTMAKKFLLDYTEKLWGRPAGDLSPEVGGARLKGLNLKTLVVETLFGSKKGVKHLDGTFYYPQLGIGQLFDEMKNTLVHGAVHLDQPVLKINHADGLLTSITTPDYQEKEVEEVISTLPLPVFIDSLDPPAPPHILDLSQSFRFREVILVTLILNRSEVTQNASLYFPDEDLPFTRIVEPKNRSRAMSPQGQTSLVIEIPCGREDELYTSSDADIISLIIEKIATTGLIKASEVQDSFVKRLPKAYPVLSVDYSAKLDVLYDYLKSFKNLQIIGRNAHFSYVHIHDLLKEAKEIMSHSGI